MQKQREKLTSSVVAFLDIKMQQLSLQPAYIFRRAELGLLSSAHWLQRLATHVLLRDDACSHFYGILSTLGEPSIGFL